VCTHTHTHTHTHTLPCSIGTFHICNDDFILCKLHILSPYTNPKPTHQRKFLHFYIFKKTSLNM